jgi:four helix bundle protein
MEARRLEDLLVWQLANSFKREVYRLVEESRGAQSDFRFRDQLREAAASVEMNIGEGFGRFRPREFIRFLEISLGSLTEAKLWLADGVDRRYWEPEASRKAHELAARSRRAIIQLIQALRRY